jgi:hypothetical protein
MQSPSPADVDVAILEILTAELATRTWGEVRAFVSEHEGARVLFREKSGWYRSDTISGWP